MTWQQITINCPTCGQPALTCRAFVHIRHLCQNCGGWFTLSSDLDTAGLPVAVVAASPDEVSLSDKGGWKEYKAK